MYPLVGICCGHRGREAWGGEHKGGTQGFSIRKQESWRGLGEHHRLSLGRGGKDLEREVALLWPCSKPKTKSGFRVPGIQEMGVQILHPGD